MPFYLDSTPWAADGFGRKFSAWVSAEQIDVFCSNAAMDGQNEPLNPYTPTTETLEGQSRPEKRDRVEWAHICFLPGTILGLNVAVAATEGIAMAIRRATIAPTGSCIFFAGFSVAAFAVSMLYRLPRRFLLGSHRPWWLACFASGFAMTFLLTGMIWVLEPFIGRSRFLFDVWPFLLVSAVGCSIAAVELEVFLSRLKYGRVNLLPTDTQSQRDDMH